MYIHVLGEIDDIIMMSFFLTDSQGSERLDWYRDAVILHLWSMKQTYK